MAGGRWGKLDQLRMHYADTRVGSLDAVARAVGPLSGLRVLDMTTSYAGPTAAMYLADLGADVVKIERPPAGDDARDWGPPFLDGASAWFASANRAKRSVAVDLAQPVGREVRPSGSRRRCLTSSPASVRRWRPRPRWCDNATVTAVN